MAKFHTHIISYGDTIQSIAQSYFGDMSQWEELAQFNNLKHPYIVDTVEEKMMNPDHLVTVGDTLLVKAAEDKQTDLISELKRTTEYDREEIFALALGKDLNILPQPRGLGDPGWDAETLEMKGNSKGDVATIRGIENLKQSLYIRLTTPKGSYIGHPNYGSELHKYLGLKNTEENATLISLEIERTLRTDGRVTHVELQQQIIQGNTYAASFLVRSLALEEAFEFVITAEQNGLIVLTDDLAGFNN